MWKFQLTCQKQQEKMRQHKRTWEQRGGEQRGGEQSNPGSY